MTIISINEKYSVSGPIGEAEIERLKQSGVTTLICGRFDNEDDGQIPTQDIAEIAQKKGLTHVHIPVKSGQYSQADISAFQQAYSASEGKIHGYCRRGSRVAHLWILSQNKPLQPLINRIRGLGIDISALTGDA